MKASDAAKSDRGDKLGPSSDNRPVVLSIRPRELGSVSTARTSLVTIARRQSNMRQEAVIAVAGRLKEDLRQNEVIHAEPARSRKEQPHQDDEVEHLRKI
jgi:hypothetical protein